MEKVTKKEDSWGQAVIYVAKCKRFKVENPDIPKIYVNKFAQL